MPCLYSGQTGEEHLQNEVLLLLLLSSSSSSSLLLLVWFLLPSLNISVNQCGSVFPLLSARAWGPNLTPGLLAIASTKRYHRNMFKILPSVFDSIKVPWDVVQALLQSSNDNNTPTNDLLEKLVELEVRDGVSRPRRLLFYEYVVSDVDEGRGVVGWHQDRIQLLVESLAFPIMDLIAAESLPKQFRDLSKRLLKEICSGGMPPKVSTELQDGAHKVFQKIRAELEAEQAKLLQLPTATLSARVPLPLPKGWDNVSLAECHRQIPWLRPYRLVASFFCHMITCSPLPQMTVRSVVSC